MLRHFIERRVRSTFTSRVCFGRFGRLGRHLGSFTLQIGPDSVRIYSDKGQRYPHPHVSSDAVPCWGNLGPPIARLLGERQYAGLVAAIVEFLHSYNERDAYRHIEHWDPDYDEDA
ncbi:MAG: hypothetical protein ACOYOB_20980 [Myxococcota bacterium]